MLLVVDIQEKNPFFENRIVVEDSRLNVGLISEVINSNDDIKDNTMTGVMSGIFTNDKEIKDTINAVTVAEVFTHLKKEVDEYYGESN